MGRAKNRQWATPQELAGLSGVPTTDRGVKRQAEREGWNRRKRPVGKGWEYVVASLPIATQIAINQRFVAGELERLKSDMTLIEQQIGELLQLRARIRRRLRGVK